MNAYQDYGGRWECGSCSSVHPDREAAEECCRPVVSDDQEALSLEEIDEAS